MRLLCREARALALAALGTLLALAAGAPAAHAALTIESFEAKVAKGDNADWTQASWEDRAGRTPALGVTAFTFGGGEHVRNVRVDLPAGLISNPEATPKCTSATLAACPAETQVGTEEIRATVLGGLGEVYIKAPIFNMVPPAGQVADFAFEVPGAGRVDVLGGLRPDDFGLFFRISNIAKDIVPASIPGLGGLTELTLRTSTLTFWGAPQDDAHNADRGLSCLGLATLPLPSICGGGGRDVAGPSKAFLRLPTGCAGPLPTTLRAESYESPGVWSSRTATTPTGAIECGAVPFSPSLSVSPGTTRRDSPSSALVRLLVPQNDDPGAVASAHMQEALVTMPPGMSINPAAANGLVACRDAQLGVGTSSAVACPAASQVGQVAIQTPVLPAPLTGKIFLGEPKPGDPYRLFLSAASDALNVKLVGSVVPDPRTGRLTATFRNTPQVPFTEFRLEFSGGPRATLATPLACGPATTVSSLKPYSGRPAAHPQSTFTVDADGAGGACPATTPFDLGFSARPDDTQAGAVTPFRMTASRQDGRQELSRLTVAMPPGLLGLLATVPLCPEDRAGAGTCAPASRVGTATVGAGAGPEPLRISGPVFLTGPYRGAPFGLAIVVRAVAGPFDLGSVVVRAAIGADRRDAHLTIAADPMPTILEGIPLRLRSVDVAVDRPGFMFNPTSCAPMTVASTLVSTGGAVRQAGAPFRATGCEKLAFRPSMTGVTSSRPTQKNGAPFRAILRSPWGANVKSVAVQLPQGFSARGSTVSQACLDTTFNADPSRCGPAAKVGTVTAETPLLSTPLTGPVYLVAHNGRLPTLEPIMSGQGLTVGLSGDITFVPSLTSAFNSVPDVPITRFVLDLPAGPNSALSAKAELCAGPVTMPVRFTSHSGATLTQTAPVSVPDCRLKITGVKVRGRTARVTVLTPAAGRLTASGRGLRSARRTAAKPGYARLTVRLSKAGARALRQRREQRRRSRRRLPLRVTVRLAPARGQTPPGATTPARAQSASRRVTFR